MHSVGMHINSHFPLLLIIEKLIFIGLNADVINTSFNIKDVLDGGCFMTLCVWTFMNNVLLNLIMKMHKVTTVIRTQSMNIKESEIFHKHFIPKTETDLRVLHGTGSCWERS